MNIVLRDQDHVGFRIVVLLIPADLRRLGSDVCSVLRLHVRIEMVKSDGEEEMG